jgi:hypothetical protein
MYSSRNRPLNRSETTSPNLINHEGQMERLIQQELHSFSQDPHSMPLGLFAINGVPQSQRRVDDPIPL